MILLATDAAGEGINLQRAHLMANYDLPWNPNKLEQRFGRIHRIGQREVCHLWNLVADETREGDVYIRLLLGQVFQGAQLRRLLMEAVRYGDQPDIRTKLDQVVDSAMDHEHLRTLARETMDATIDLILEQYRDLLKRGAVLVDPADPGEDARVLFYLEPRDVSADRCGYDVNRAIPPVGAFASSRPRAGSGGPIPSL